MKFHPIFSTGSALHSMQFSYEVEYCGSFICLGYIYIDWKRDRPIGYRNLNSTDGRSVRRLTKSQSDAVAVFTPAGIMAAENG